MTTVFKNMVSFWVNTLALEIFAVLSKNTHTTVYSMFKYLTLYSQFFFVITEPP